MTEMFGEAWSPMSVPDLAPDDDERIDQKIMIFFCCNFILFNDKNKCPQGNLTK